MSAVTALPRTTAPPVSLTLKRFPHFTRMLTGAAAAALMGLLVFAGFASDAPVARADGVTCPFGNADEAPENYASENYLSGPTTLNPMTDVVTGKMMQNIKVESRGNRPVTAYEYYKMSGTTWTVSLGTDYCWAADARISNTTANYLFSLSKSVTTMSISMYEWASAPDLMADFLKPMEKVVKGLKQNLYLNFLSPVIVLGAMWMGWQGLVKKRTSEATQAAVWMICSATFALIFMAWPAAIAGWGNTIVSTVNATAMSAVTTATSNTVNKGDICYLPTTAPKAGVRMASCSLYKALVFTPWAAGQFGAAASQPITGSEASAKVTIPGHKTSNDLRLAQLEAQATNHEEAAKGQASTSAREAVVKADAERWKYIQTRAEKDWWGPAWSGTSGDSRINIGFASVVASVSAGFLVLIISFSGIVLALAMIMLIMISPLFLLIGAHPGFGRGIALKWAELLLGTVVKRIVLGLLLAILIGFYQVILATSMAWFTQVALIIAVGIGAIMFRKPMLEAMNVVNLGGTRSGLENMDPSRHMKKAGTSSVGAATGAISGGRTGLASGGLKGAAMGAVGGGFSGGVSGGRSGSVLRAGKMGMGAGREVANRQGARRAAAEEAQDPFAYGKQQDTKAKQIAEAQRLADQHADDPEMQRRLRAWAEKQGMPVPRPGGGKPKGPGTPAPQTPTNNHKGSPAGYENITTKPNTGPRVAGATRRPPGAVGSGIPSATVSGAPRVPAGARTVLPSVPAAPRPGGMSGATARPAVTPPSAPPAAAPTPAPTTAPTASGAADLATQMLARQREAAAARGLRPNGGQ